MMVISAQPGEGGGCPPSPFHSVYLNDMYRLYEGVAGGGMGLFLIVVVGHWPKILPQNSKGAS
jgi:hypothetical protein